MFRHGVFSRFESLHGSFLSGGKTQSELLKGLRRVLRNPFVWITACPDEVAPLLCLQLLVTCEACIFNIPYIYLPATFFEHIPAFLNLAPPMTLTAYLK